METLFFGEPNAKLKKYDSAFGTHTATFSLPAGYSCPSADKCLARFNRETNKLEDGSSQEFRCFFASMEARFKQLREATSRNFEMLRSKDRFAQAELILRSLPKKADRIRIHVGGDFFSKNYLGAWCDVARQRPEVKFYAYTKSLPILKAMLSEIPSNLVITPSMGGRHDAMIPELTPYAKASRVVFSEEEARELGLEIDHDDSHASDGDRPFALLIHNAQRSGSEAAKAVARIQAQERGSK